MRICENFDKGWKFTQKDIQVLHAVKSGMAGGLTDCQEMEQGEWLKIAYFDERETATEDWSLWQEVCLPHDWCVEGEYQNPPKFDKHLRDHGYLKTGVGHYRKEFTVPEDWKGQKVGLEIEGIFRCSTVWVNGHELKHHESGYTGFYVDMTDVLRYGSEGKNVILIRVDAREDEGWWYEGAGIYRHIWLTVSDRLHVKRHGITVTTSVPEETKAEVCVRVELENESFRTQDWTIRVETAGQSQQQTGHTGYYDESACCFTFAIENPALWSPETPSLYEVKIDILRQEKVVDEVKVSYGVRTVAFDPDRGFLLNGKPYVLKGVCCHQDFAGVGIALTDDLIDHRLKLLKEMGCNAYRSAHHAATPHLLDACDRMGVLVIDENRKLDSSEQGMADLRELILRGKNHPCIFMWSMENEEILEGTTMGTRILQTLTTLTHKLDPTRPAVAAMNHGWNDGGYSEIVDIIGYNYGQREDQDVNDHLKYPSRCMVGSESASCTVTRGQYADDAEKGYCPEYGTHIPEWSCTIEKAWTDVCQHPHLSGVFIWTGFDYRGEPTPYEWPNISSHFGIMDTCGFPKDMYYYLKSEWTNENVLHIMPHWNWNGQEGQTKDVWIYGSCSEAELFLNGKSLGRKKKAPHSHLEWQVDYAPGVLSAVGYDENGTQISEAKMETAGVPAAVELHPRVTGDAVFVEARLVDDKGNLVPDDDRLVTFVVSGSGKILGVGNGDPSCHESDKANCRSTFVGKCLVILQKGEGETMLTASAPGLAPAQLTI